MNSTLQGMASVLARAMLCGIFLLSALGNKIPHFDQVVAYMSGEGVPFPQLLLPGAIAFLIAGSLMVVTGYQARIGASLLLIFLAAATYYFHDFWTLSDPQRQQMETISFMKNLGLAGAMLLIMVNGSGRWSLDNYLASRSEEALPGHLSLGKMRA